MSVTRVTGIASGMDTESIIKQLSAKYVDKKDKVWKEKESLKYKQDVWKDMNKDIYGLYTKLSNLRMSGTYQKAEATSSNEKVASVTGDKISGQQQLTVNQIATKTFITGGKVEQSEPIRVTGTLAVRVGGKEQDLNITPDMSMEEVARKLTEAGIVANFDKDNARLFLSSKTTGANSDFEIGGDDSLLESMGLGSSAIKQIGQDSSITLNGVTFTSSKNEYKLNGMNITASSVGSTVIGSQNDNKIYDVVKSFIDDYNSLIKKIDTAYNTNNKSYKPLTDDEKYNLSDKQIEDWEKKIKDGILYKDANLGTISNVMKNTMASTCVDGKYLSSFGITLGNYFTTEKEERGVYNIDEDKLKKAIEEDPDKVMNFMTKLAANLYDNIGKEMKSSSLRSVYTVYDDKQINQDLKDLEDKITAWEDKITAIEDKYYDKFARMEKLLSSSQSQSNYLTNFFEI